MLLFADITLGLLHGLLVAFNLTGWMWSRTRRAHIAVLGATLLSWFGLGLAYGWGYCPLTDWQWRIKRARGETGMPGSFVKYYVDRLPGGPWDAVLIDAISLVLAVGLLAVSLILLVRERREVS